VILDDTQTAVPEEGTTSTTNTGSRDAAWLVKDNQAFTIITLNSKDSQISYIQNCTTAKDAWEALKEVHQGIGSNGWMVLMQRLWGLHMREGDDMAVHLNTFRELANQVASLSTEGIGVVDADLVSMLSLSLPDSYEPLIMALHSRSEVTTFDFLIGRLLQESTRRASQSTNSQGLRIPDNSAFVALRLGATSEWHNGTLEARWGEAAVDRADPLERVETTKEVEEVGLAGCRVSAIIVRRQDIGKRNASKGRQI
jgi:hypothetical protein